MQERYGLDHRPLGRWIGIAVIVVAFAGVLVWVATVVSEEPARSRLVSWDVQGPDRVDITIQVAPNPDADITCVLRSQDSSRIDVGYATVTVPPGPRDPAIITTYRLRTIAPAYTAELLGCEIGQPPRVATPQFPPGVAPPVQPWTDGS